EFAHPGAVQLRSGRVSPLLTSVSATAEASPRRKWSGTRRPQLERLMGRGSARAKMGGVNTAQSHMLAIVGPKSSSAGGWWTEYRKRARCPRTKTPAAVHPTNDQIQSFGSRRTRRGRSGEGAGLASAMIRPRRAPGEAAAAGDAARRPGDAVTGMLIAGRRWNRPSGG